MVPNADRSPGPFCAVGLVLPPALGDIGTALIVGLAMILGVGLLVRTVRTPAKPGIATQGG